jgi:hypothetical protein
MVYFPTLREQKEPGLIDGPRLPEFLGASYM